jgi:hypothetical protein
MKMLTMLRTARDVYRANIDEGYAGGTAFEQFMVQHSDTYHLCQEFDEDGHPTDAGMAKAEQFIARAKKWGKFRWWLYHQTSVVQSIFTALHCEWSGHELVDNSYGGPDSGCMAMHCSRCGWSFHHTLY